MRFQFTPDSQRRFKAGLARVASRLNKTLLDLLRQTAVYYAQAARKRTPGPWYGAMTKTMRERPVRPISDMEARTFRREGGKFWPTHVVEVWRGTQRSGKHPVMMPTKNEQSPLRRIKYRGAAQLSWSAMLKKLFKTEPPPAASGANFLRVLTQGASVAQGHEGNWKPYIATENHLGYIARLRPGIVQEALLSAQNRVANAYIAKLGRSMETEWNRS